MLFSELCSVHSLRRFPSVNSEYAAVVSCASVTQQYSYIGSCIDVWKTCTKSFSVVSFTQLKKKCLQKLVLSPTSPTHYWLIASAHATSYYGTSMAMATLWIKYNNTILPQLKKLVFVNTFSLVVWNSQHWNFSCEFVRHLCRNICMDIAEWRSHAILQLHILCWLTESVVKCEQSWVHWKAYMYTSSCVCRWRECKNCRLSTQLQKSARKSLDDQSHSSVVSSKTQGKMPSAQTP